MFKDKFLEIFGNIHVSRILYLSVRVFYLDEYDGTMSEVSGAGPKDRLNSVVLCIYIMCSPHYRNTNASIIVCLLQVVHPLQLRKTRKTSLFLQETLRLWLFCSHCLIDGAQSTRVTKLQKAQGRKLSHRQQRPPHSSLECRGIGLRPGRSGVPGRAFPSIR